MDISSIATVIVSFISPYLAKGGEEFFKEAGKDLWDTIKQKFSGEKDEKLLKDYTDNPSDLKGQGKIELKIAEKLENDKSFLVKVQDILSKLDESKDELYIASIKQIHSGTGDNVGRDKIQK